MSVFALVVFVMLGIGMGVVVLLSELLGPGGSGKRIYVYCYLRDGCRFFMRGGVLEVHRVYRVGSIW